MHMFCKDYSKLGTTPNSYQKKSSQKHVCKKVKLMLLKDSTNNRLTQLNTPKGGGGKSRVSLNGRGQLAAQGQSSPL